ncbi:CU044_5270 family protein [Kribbella sp. NPDC051770]|uniref:CU044_5270 family protein n=1 Tax=Kribbella sp. NPDC051770 TaxID=3155413 RepID=UPI00341D4745
MTDNKLTDLWSEDDLDRAMTALHSDEAEPDHARLAQARAQLMAAAGGPRTALGHPVDLAGTAHRVSAGDPRPARFSAGAKRTARRRWTYGLAAAASVAALVGTGFIVTSGTQGGSAEAKTELDAAAANVTAKDPVVKPGQYLHNTARTWTRNLYGGNGFELQVLEEQATETWIPADRKAEWVMRTTQTGRHQWVVGSDAEARKHGITFAKTTDVQRADCGGFYGAGCDTAGSWANPTPEWIAGLPTDPKALYERLKKDAPGNSRGETELLVYAQDALRTGLLPADVRARLYRALGYLKNLEISDRAANLDGKTGIAYGSDDGKSREEIIVDPKTGAYIGSREVDTDGKGKGDVITFTSLSANVADTAPRR